VSDDLVEKTEAAAAVWLARQDRGFCAADEAAFAAWLERSTFNRVAYLRLKSAWSRADRLAALKQPPMRQSRARRTSSWLGLAAAGLAALLAGGYWALDRPPPQTDYATTLGHRETVRLADGTRMELNTDTKVHAEVTEKKRIVTLDSGEVYFDVVHDARRPFVVLAGNRRITDLGTKFSVYRNGDDVQVTVTQGRVQVDILNKPAVAAPVEATGGNVVMARRDETLVVSRPLDEIRQDLSWRRGMLIFNQETLAEAAAQFNRYNAKQILVKGKARKIRIGGSFKIDNVDGFTALIHRGFGLSIREEDNRVIVSD
jgi:transmembrane sensor